jgi:hypothetical protein
MNWDALGAIAELIGGVAVLITLVYLATQVRQSNQMQRQQISTEQTNRYHANAHILASNPELVTIYRKAMVGEDLTEEERWRFGSFMYALVLDFEEMFYFHEDGAQYDFRWHGMQMSIYLGISKAQTIYTAIRPTNR